MGQPVHGRLLRRRSSGGKDPKETMSPAVIAQVMGFLKRRYGSQTANKKTANLIIAIRGQKRDNYVAYC
jgi:hypothetical protein